LLEKKDTPGGVHQEIDHGLNARAARPSPRLPKIKGRLTLLHENNSITGV